MAHNYYLDKNKKKLIRQVIREHWFHWETLRDRSKGVQSAGSIFKGNDKL
jgi:hypothetical protein